MTKFSAGRPALPLRDVERAERRSRSAGPWSLDHLRRCWWVLAGVAVVMVVTVALAVGTAGAAGAALGMAITGVFFTVSTVVIAYVGARRPTMVLATALGMYLVKIVALGVVIFVFPRHGPIDAQWMAIAVVVGLFAWMAAHLHYVLTSKLFYVDPQTSGHDNVA